VSLPSPSATSPSTTSTSPTRWTGNATRPVQYGRVKSRFMCSAGAMKCTSDSPPIAASVLEANSGRRERYRSVWLQSSGPSSEPGASQLRGGRFRSVSGSKRWNGRLGAAVGMPGCANVVTAWVVGGDCGRPMHCSGSADDCSRRRRSPPCCQRSEATWPAEAFDPSPMAIRLAKRRRREKLTPAQREEVHRSRVAASTR
jgi:hypothetical protein